MSTRDSPGGKGGRCVRLTTYHPCSAERQEIWGLNLPGPPWAISTACCGRDFYLYLYIYIFVHRVCKYRLSHAYNVYFEFKAWLPALNISTDISFPARWLRKPKVWILHLTHFLVHINSQLGEFDLQCKEAMKKRRISLGKELNGA